MVLGRPLAALLLALAVSGAHAGPRVYRHSEDGAPASLDPAQAGTVHAALVVRAVYDTPLAYRYLARPYVLAPNLAAALPDVSPDGLTWTIRLKGGVRFADDACFPGGKGREVTAADLAYSISRHFDPRTRSQGAWLWDGRIAGLAEWRARGAKAGDPVAGLVVDDARTLRIVLTRPYPTFAHTLATPFAAVVPHEAVERYGRDFARHPVGSGPFAVASADTSRTVLVRNASYRSEPLRLADEGFDPKRDADLDVAALEGRSPPFVDRVEIEWIAEPTARWLSFTKGTEIDYTVLPADRYDQVLATRNPVALNAASARAWRVRAEIESGLVLQAFNLDDPALGHVPDAAQDARNHDLRCAISSAFDWTARNAAFYGGLARIFPGVLTPSMPEFDASATMAPVDRERAKRLLAGAGFTAANVPVLEDAIAGGVIHRDMHEQFAGFLAALGWPSAKVRLKTFPTFGAFNEAQRTRRLQTFQTGWSLDIPDAENTLQLFYGPNVSPGANFSNYRNPRYDALYERFTVLAPGAERTRLAREMNRLLVDDCAAVSGASRTRVSLWSRRVHALPDREFNNGYWLRFVAVDP